MIIDERDRTAIHEAGHACVAMVCSIGVDQAEISANGHTGRVFGIDVWGVPLVDSLAFYAAGAVAEALAGDGRIVSAIDWRCERLAGDVESVASALDRSRDDAVRSPLFAAAVRRAADVISPRLQDVERLALELQVHGEMDAVQVRRSLAWREDAQARRRCAAAQAYRASAIGRARESANFAAWVRAGRPQVPTAYPVDWWNTGVRAVDASGRRHVLFAPPFPIQ